MRRRQDVAFRAFNIMWREVDVGRDEILDNIEQHLLISHVAHLIKQLETADDLLDVAAEATKVVLDVGQEDLLVIGGCAVKLLQRPLAGVIEHIAGSLA